MKKSKFTDSQIVFSLRQAEEGTAIEEDCRKTGMTAMGQNRKSVKATRMSAFGGKAEVDFGRLDVCSLPIRLTQTPTTCRVRPFAGI